MTDKHVCRYSFKWRAYSNPDSSPVYHLSCIVHLILNVSLYSVKRLFVSARTDNLLSQLAAARRKVVRKAKAAWTEGDSPKDNKDASSPYLTSNRPTYIEDGQDAASSEPAAVTQPIPRVKFANEGEMTLADQSEEFKTLTPKGAGFRFGRKGRVRMMRSSAAQLAAASCGRKSRVIEVRLSAAVSHRVCQNK